jgi:hypothetical protein
VAVNSSGPLFEAAKAAQLNQCMVFAVLEAAARAKIPLGRSQGHMSGVEPVLDGSRPIGISAAGRPVTTAFEHVIVRHGPDRDARYQPAGALYTNYRSYIQALLATRPELGEPPELAPETYDRFASPAIAALYDSAVHPVMLVQHAQQQSTIVIGIDPATNVVVERGESVLHNVADQGERLATPVTIQLDLPPAQLVVAKDLVRLARASNGRIRLQALPAHHAAWHALCNSINAATIAPLHYRSRELGLPEIARSVDACLGRLLNTRLTQIFNSGSCPTIGQIDRALLTQIGAIWLDWRSSLDGDGPLREHVFRLLAHVHQLEASPWTGDHACLDEMTSALVMMLATHHGQTLELAVTERGNLRFEADAIALGTVCRLIGGQPLADVWTEAQQWGVDALIISSSSEIQIAPAPAGTVMNGGTIGKGITQARQVRPAIIQNDSFWRKKLAGDLNDWRVAVAKEFADLRDRQDEQFDKVAL